MRTTRDSNDILLPWGISKSHGPVWLDNVVFNRVDSTLDLPQYVTDKVDATWAGIVEKNPHAFDGKLWRFEHLKYGHGILKVDVSPITYKWHNVGRHESLAFGESVNPLSVNVISETLDGKLLIGVRGKTSDQKGAAIAPAGFLDRYEASDVPKPLAYTTFKETFEELLFNHDRADTVDLRETRVLGLVYGSNRDTTIAIYNPLNVTSDEVTFGNDEHSDLLFLSNNPDAIREVTQTRKFQGIPAADHMVGCLELYQDAKDLEYVASAKQH